MFPNSMIEDKTCRICGFVDTRNVNIFDPKWKNILYKILTIFPITLYATDPLPKNICKKCVTNVTMIFDECQKLLKVQKKWIDNVRANQPDHPYVYILDMIERSNKDVVTNIKNIAPDFQYRAFRPLFEYHHSMTSDFSEADNESFTKDDINRIFTHDKNSYNDLEAMNTKHIIIDSKKSSSQKERGFYLNDLSMEEMPPSPQMSESFEDKIREIKNKLQSNGCTLMSITSPNEYEHRHRNWFSSRDVSCCMCGRNFPNEKFLSKHMLTHAEVSVQRIFDEKCLNRKIRRGRLITMGDNKCIRCLNCWKIFPDNRGILDHWTNCACEFYCQICGKEFPNSPKMLREHVPAQHGISYKSSRRRTHTSTEVTKKEKVVAVVTKKPPVPTVIAPKMKKEPAPPKESLIKPLPQRKRKGKKFHPSKRVTCEICLSTFANFQARNSHMRIHKNDIPIITAPITYNNILNSNNVKSNNTKSNNIKSNNFNSSTQHREEIPIPEIKKEPEDQCEPITQLLETEYSEPVVKQEKPDNGYEEYMQPVFPQQNRIQIAAKQTSQPVLAPRKPLSTKPESFIDKLKPPGEILDYGGRLYNCHPCGKKFLSKTELYDHKKRCQLNNKYACRFCLRAFITSADLQVHIMLMHRSS